MRKKFISIIICMLLISSTIILVPKEKNVKAESGSGNEDYPIGIDYNFIK